MGDLDYMNSANPGPVISGSVALSGIGAFWVIYSSRMPISEWIQLIEGEVTYPPTYQFRILVA